MAIKYMFNPFTGNLDVVKEVPNPMSFEGAINIASDFPTSADVQTGWFYYVATDVTDDDASKTNTGLSFLAGDEIAWTGSTWVEIGSTDIWRDDGTQIYPVNLARNVGIGTATPDAPLTVQAPALQDPTFTTFHTDGSVAFEMRTGDVGDSNLFLGKDSGSAILTTGIENTGVGSGALHSVTSGDENMALGKNALYYVTTGGYNTAMGRHALRKTTANFNVGVGYRAGEDNTTGSGNTFVGVDAGREKILGSNNTAIGYAAGSGVNTVSGYDNNVLIGYQTGSRLTSGSSNILIGYDIYASAVDVSNELNIGDTIFGDLSTGNVGIGTTSPQNKLDIEGGAVIGATYSGTNTAPTNGLLVEGKVGIGVAPVEKLDVNGGMLVRGTLAAGGVSGIYLSYDSDIATLWSYGSDATTKTGFRFIQRQSDGGDSSTPLTIDGNNKVGIGTTAPNSLLHVYEGNSAVTPNVVSHFNIESDTHAGMSIMTPNTQTQYYIFADPQNALAGYMAYDHNTDKMHFATNGANEMTIDTAGRVGIGTITPTEALDVRGRVVEEGTFANIYVEDGSTAQSIATGVTYTKLTGFATDGESANCTTDVANDKITITKLGRYMVNFSLNGSSGSNNVTFKTAAFLNGTEQGMVHSHRKYAAGGDNGSESGCGIIDVTTVPWDLDLRTRHDNGGAVNFTLTYASLNVIYLGQT